MRAVKGNKVYTIDETQQKFYVDSGFDILDDQGDVVAYGRGKTIPYGDYAVLKKEKEQLEKENIGLKEQLGNMQKTSAEKTTKKAGKSTGEGEGDVI